nr:MAG TPA_asm: hypothetical protein [Caudoviricetes sp.]
MFLKVLLVIAIMVMWSSGYTPSLMMKDNVEHKQLKTFVVMLDNKIVEYYMTHSNQLPPSDDGCVSSEALKVMGLQNCDLFRNNTKIRYSINADNTFTLTADFNGTPYVTKNSNKPLQEAVKEMY